MLRLFSLLVCLLWLSACAQLPEWMPPSVFSAGPVDNQTARFSFAWELSGDQDIGPVQVFDNGRQTWLQFQPGQTLPAIFAGDEQGERPLRYTRQDDYIIINGVESVLIFRGGQLKARATKKVDEKAIAQKAHEEGTAAEAGSLAETVESPSPDRSILGEAQTAALSADALESSTSRRDAHPVEVLTDASFDRLSRPSAVTFSLRYDDATLRHALQRWARQAGWTFSPEHWALDVDIPVSAEADFGTVFQPAVQALLAATELSDRPVQPCFYTNQVVRVVPFTHACDRGSGDTP